MKHYLANELGQMVCIDTQKKTSLRVFNGSINFDTGVDTDWDLKWYLSHGCEPTTQQEFDDYYKKQVEILNSIVSC